MKTHVIQLEPHDDLTSIRDKMAWAKTPRILLVWPLRRSVNIRPLDMVLLQRHATSLGAQLGITARSGDISRSATELGIPVFHSSKEAQSELWNTQSRRQKYRRGQHRKKSWATLKKLRESFVQKEPAWLKNPYVRIIVFSMGVLAVLIFFVLFLPSAKISLKPVTQIQSMAIPIIIDPGSKGVSITGVIPAYPINVLVEGNGDALATGKMTMPEARASGFVRFRNLTSSPVTVPEGTIIRTIDLPAIRYFVSKSGEVPGGIGKTLDLPVRALEGGVSGNLTADSLQAIEGSKGLSLTVTNPEATTGGQDVIKTVANSKDRSKLHAQLAETLLKQARTKITQQIPAGAYLLADSLVGETVSEIYDPPEGKPDPRLSLVLNQQYQAYYVLDGDIKSLEGLVLDSSLPEGYSPISGSLTLTPIGEPITASDGRLTWQVRGDRKISANINLFDIMSSVLGKTPETAKGNLTKLNLASSPEISISPSWWFWLPTLPLRIAVVTTP